jgi:hypothetical protein
MTPVPGPYPSPEAGVMGEGTQIVFETHAISEDAERGFLEFRQGVPYAGGGNATEANIALRCRAHNGYEAEREFGGRASKWRGGARACEPETTYSRVINSPRGEWRVSWAGCGPRRCTGTAA